MRERNGTLDTAMQQVRHFLDRAAGLSTVEATRLSREGKRVRGRLAKDLDESFLSAVSSGAWGAEHRSAAREIRAESRAQAAKLVPWPRRGAAAAVLEDAALVVLSEADPQHPLSEELCQRLAGPWERATGSPVRPAAGLPSS